MAADEPGGSSDPPGDSPLTPGDPLPPGDSPPPGEPLPPPPEPPPLPEAPGPLPPDPGPFAPPAAPGAAPPPAYPPPPPQAFPPPQASPPPAVPPTLVQPGYGQPPPGGYQQPPGAWQPPPPQAKGPHGENLYGQHELAGWGSRVGALLLDTLFTVLIGAVGAGIGVGLLLTGVTGLEVIGIIVLVLTYIFIVVLFRPLLLARGGERNGQTWGKQIVGIRVVRDTQQSLSLGYGVLREFVVVGLLFGFIGGTFLIPPLLDYLWPLWDDENRTLHDMIVSTHVVRADSGTGAAPPSAFNAG